MSNAMRRFQSANSLHPQNRLSSQSISGIPHNNRSSNVCGQPSAPPGCKQPYTHSTPLHLPNSSLDLSLPGTIPSGCGAHHPQNPAHKQTIDTENADDLQDAGQKIRKRIRPNRAAARWARYQAEAKISFVLPTEDDESPKEIENLNHTITASLGSKPTFYYFVPPKRQHDPNPSELLTSQATLKASYYGLSFGTCVIAPQNGLGFCKFQTIPFSSMSPKELQSWEKLVCFFLDQINFVGPVKNNGPLMGGWMWACGWRKGMKQEGFGRYFSVGRLAAMIRKCRYNDQDKAVAYQEANEWIATHLQELAPRAFKEY
ncbi:hypothetical protein PTTG_29456 [Puccinia triticina 1-1 BBBD Race 1]|uniref:Tet-like 2OG-Fe(II) oxygenase domain-containing protein n=1 Tax=Puccinia triticina (isolate 1-1 / race 1 (BBBD)) TaxID=630390 RepID=A0A180G3Y7_PUCT1|nr:hypothetical protein PTTG_29456 [Puccinia triticina 1-1 BBBD Race 1]